MCAQIFPLWVNENWIFALFEVPSLQVSIARLRRNLSQKRAGSPMAGAAGGWYNETKCRKSELQWQTNSLDYPNHISWAMRRRMIIWEGALIFAVLLAKDPFFFFFFISMATENEGEAVVLRLQSLFVIAPARRGRIGNNVLISSSSYVWIRHKILLNDFW